MTTFTFQISREDGLQVFEFQRGKIRLKIPAYLAGHVLPGDFVRI